MSKLSHVIRGLTAGLGSDCRSALRQCKHNALTTSLAVFTLTVGFGATTAALGTLNAHLFDAPPIHNPQDLREVFFSTNPSEPALFPVETYQHIRDHSMHLVDVMCLGEEAFIRSRDIAGGGLAYAVSGNLYHGVGLGAALGRTITPDDDQDTAPVVVMISNGFWRSRFGGEPTAVGRTISVNGNPVTIVGVTATGLRWPPNRTVADITVPLAHERVLLAGAGAKNGHRSMCQIAGRLSPGSSWEEAAAEADYLVREGERLAGADTSSIGIGTVHMRRFDRGIDVLAIGSVDWLSVVGVASVVMAIVLITCANIGGMLLVRGVGRQGEIATRLGLGASRARIVRQLVVESVAVTLFGATLGLWVGNDVGALMRRVVGIFTFDMVLTAMVLLAALTIGVLMGVVPALAATRFSVASGISHHAQSMPRKLPGAGVLVMVQVVLSFLLLFSTGLHLRSLSNLQADATSSQPDVVSFVVEYPASRAGAFYARDLSQHLSDVPGVRSVVTSGASVPAVACVSDGAGRNRLAPVQVREVGPTFLGAADILRGRGMSWNDSARGPDIAIVSESFAERVLTGVDPLGRTVRLADTPRSSASDIQCDHERVIVGIAKDVRAVGGSTPTAVYVPLSSAGPLRVAVRTFGDPATLLDTLQQTISAFDSDATIARLETNVRARQEDITAARLISMGLMFAAVVALLQVSLGLMGTVGYTISKRTREIGIRVALGAQRMHIITLILRDTFIPIVLGMSIGAVAMPGASRVFAQNLFGDISPTSQLYIAVVAATVMTATVLAASAPAWRASRRDPTPALRAE